MPSGPTTRRTPQQQRAIADFDRSVRMAMRVHARPGEAILVAVSGGPDSTALLIALARIARSRPQLSVVYVDHGTRPPAERDADAAFVRARCDELGLTFVRRHAVPAGESEDALRRARYAELRQAASDAGATAVALGHTADDQAETVLLHLVRGAGLRGIGGMAPRAPWPFPELGEGPGLLRPMLALSRANAEAYVVAHGFAARRDPSNTGGRYTRNRLRASVLPALLAENPRAIDAIARAAASARAAAAFIEQAAELALADVRAGPGELRAAATAALPEAVRHAVILRELRACAPADAEMGAEAATRVDDLLGGPAGRSADVGGGLCATRTAGAIVVAAGRLAAEPLPLVTLAPTGTTRAGPWEASIEHAADAKATGDGNALDVTDEFAAGPLTVRSRRPGDRIRLAAGTRKVHDVLVDAKVPRTERDTIPLLCDGEGRVRWIAGVRADPAIVRRGGPGPRVVFRRASSEGAEESGGRR